DRVGNEVVGGQPGRHHDEPVELAAAHIGCGDLSRARVLHHNVGIAVAEQVGDDADHKPPGRDHPDKPIIHATLPDEVGALAGIRVLQHDVGKTVAVDVANADNL